VCISVCLNTAARFRLGLRPLCFKCVRLKSSSVECCAWSACDSCFCAFSSTDVLAALGKLLSTWLALLRCLARFASAHRGSALSICVSPPPSSACASSPLCVASSVSASCFDASNSTELHAALSKQLCTQSAPVRLVARAAFAQPRLSSPASTISPLSLILFSMFLRVFASVRKWWPRLGAITRCM
jgi:hypothetical protein